MHYFEFQVQYSVRNTFLRFHSLLNVKHQRSYKIFPGDWVYVLFVKIEMLIRGWWLGEFDTFLPDIKYCEKWVKINKLLSLAFLYQLENLLIFRKAMIMNELIWDSENDSSKNENRNTNKKYFFLSSDDIWVEKF